jgi:hypothetical protein
VIAALEQLRVTPLEIVFLAAIADGIRLGLVDVDALTRGRAAAGRRLLDGTPQQLAWRLAKRAERDKLPGISSRGSGSASTEAPANDGSRSAAV